MFGGLQSAAQDMEPCPVHKQHVNEASRHQAYVEKHGDGAMGFPHDKTTHHFRLSSDGGHRSDRERRVIVSGSLRHGITLLSNFVISPNATRKAFQLLSRIAQQIS
jgi:hypothetical protein